MPKVQIESILEARNARAFAGFKDFLIRVDLRRVNKKTVESLIKAGAFLLFANRATLLYHYPTLVREIQSNKTVENKGQFGLFADEKKSASKKDEFLKQDEFSEDQVLEMEREVIGFHIAQNPLTKFQSIISEKTDKKIGDINDEDVGKTHILAGIIISKKVVKTKKDGSDMAFLTIFDETGSVETVIFPTLFAKFKDVLSLNQPLLFKGKVAKRDERLSIVIDNLRLLS